MRKMPPEIEQQKRSAAKLMKANGYTYDQIAKLLQITKSRAIWFVTGVELNYLRATKKRAKAFTANSCETHRCPQCGVLINTHECMACDIKSVKPVKKVRRPYVAKVRDEFSQLSVG